METVTQKRFWMTPFRSKSSANAPIAVRFSSQVLANQNSRHETRVYDHSFKQESVKHAGFFHLNSIKLV